MVGETEEKKMYTGFKLDEVWQKYCSLLCLSKKILEAEQLAMREYRRIDYHAHRGMASGLKEISYANKICAFGEELCAQARKLEAEGKKLWAEAILKRYGDIHVEWGVNGSCRLQNGEYFEFIKEIPHTRDGFTDD
jgi:hypothetical protein